MFARESVLLLFRLYERVPKWMQQRYQPSRPGCDSRRDVTSANANLASQLGWNSFRVRANTVLAAASATPIVLDRSATHHKAKNRFGTIGQFSQRQDAFFRPIAQGYSRSRAPEQYHRAVLFACSSSRANNSAKIRFYNTFSAVKISIDRVTSKSIGTRARCADFSFFSLRFQLLYFFSLFKLKI